MLQTIPAEFHGTALTIIDHAGQKWLTSQEVGICLGYTEANARTGITNLYNRHADEFTETDTCAIKLMAQGQMRETRVFSHTGCNMLGFFANTPRAKDFRAWAKQVLAGQVPASVHAPQPKGKVRITRHVERLVLEAFVAGQSRKEIGKALGIAASTVHQLLHAQYRFSPDAGAEECDQDLVNAVADRHLDIETERMLAARQRLAQKYLPHANNQMLADALEYIGENLVEPMPALLEG